MIIAAGLMWAGAAEKREKLKVKFKSFSKQLDHNAPGMDVTTGFQVSVAHLCPHGAHHRHLRGSFLANTE